LERVRNMRVVVNPTYWTGNVVGHSISLSVIDTAKALSMLPNVHVIMPVPKDRHLWQYTDASLEGIDQVIEVEYMRKFTTHFATEDWWKHFNVGSGDTFYDVMLEFNGKIAVQMDNYAMAGNYTNKFFLPAPITVCSIVRPAFLVYELLSRPHAHLLETIAQASMPTMFLTEYQKDLLEVAARKYLSPTLLRSMGTKNVVVPHSIAVDRIKFKPRKNPEKVRIMFATTLSAVKQADKIGKMFEKMLKLGKPVELVASLPFRRAEIARQYIVEEFKEKAYKELSKYTELHVNPPREQYERLLEGADVFVCMSKNESFGLSFFEQLQAGQVGIYLKKPWQKGLLPEEYPFICETEEEVFARLLWVVDNLEEAQSRIAFMEDWLAEHVGKMSVAKKMERFISNCFAEVLEIDYQRMKDQWLYKAMESRLRRERYSMEDVARVIKEETNTNIFVESTMYGHTVRRMMQLLGYEDILNKEGLPVFERRVR